MEALESKENIVQVSVRFPKPMHRRLSQYVDSLKYGDTPTSLNAEILTAVDQRLESLTSNTTAAAPEVISLRQRDFTSQSAEPYVINNLSEKEYWYLSKLLYILRGEVPPAMAVLPNLISFELLTRVATGEKLDVCEEWQRQAERAHTESGGLLQDVRTHDVGGKKARQGKRKKAS